MATNWVKDGLDAYLSLTGEHRAEEKAAADRDFQQQSMTLAQNADQRQGAAAGLTNQLTQQHIDKGKREKEDDARWDNLLLDYGVETEEANPFTPTTVTIKDPAKVEMSRYVYGNNLKTAAFARDAVAKMGNMSIPVDKLAEMAPAHVQDTVKHIFGPAAAKRAGQESFNPATGKVGIITGKVGHINIEKNQNGEGYLSADMEVQDEDGSIRYAPFTNRTDDPNQLVKRIPLAALEHEANSVIQGIDDALRTGANPALTITKRKIAGSETWPLQYKKDFIQDRRKQEENMRTRESDVVTTKKVGKALESMKGRIDALPWREDPHVAVTDLYTTLSQSGMTAPEVDKAVTRIVAAKVPAEKALKIEEVGAGGDLVQKAIVGTDGKITPIGKPYPKHAKPAPTTDKDLLLVKRDISTRLREAQRGYSAAVKTGNPDTVAEAVDYIEALNGDAKAYGVPTLPVPARPMTSDEETALYDQATNTVRSKQGRVAKAIGIDPNKQDIEAEFQRLKQQPKPKAARPAGADMSPSDTLHSPSNRKQTTPRQQTTPQNQGALNGVPPAAQHTGRIIKDTASGKRYQSNGASWLEVQ